MNANEPAPGLTWGIKSSFTRYVMNLPDGRYLDEDGAALVPPDLFFFPLEDDTEWNTAAGTGILRFRGRVLLTAHAGILSLELMNPWIEVASEGAVMSVANVDGDDARAALLDLAWGADRDAIPAQLAAGSEQIFNGQYPVGTAMDPIRIVLRAPK